LKIIGYLEFGLDFIIYGLDFCLDRRKDAMVVVGPVIAFSFIPPREMNQFSIFDIRDETKEAKNDQDSQPTRHNTFFPRVYGVRKI